MNYIKYLDLAKESFGAAKKCWWAIPSVRQFAEYDGITPKEYLSKIDKKVGIESTDKRLEALKDKPLIYAYMNK